MSKVCAEPGCDAEIDEKYTFCYPHQMAKKIVKDMKSPQQKLKVEESYKSDLMVWPIRDRDPWQVAAQVNQFSKNRRVRATQTVVYGDHIVAFVYFEPTTEDMESGNYDG